MPTWHVLGAGNLGCIWAVRLKHAGHRVHIVLKNADYLARYDGIHIYRANGARDHFHIPASLLPVDPIRNVLITTKAHDVVPAIRQLIASQPLNIVVLQNGMIDIDEVRAVVGAQTRVLVATTTEGAQSLKPFHIRPAGDGETLLGTVENEEVLHMPGMRWVGDVRPMLWRKLGLNCVACPLGALHQCLNGEIPSIPDYETVARSILEEVAAVAKAMDGVVLDVHEGMSILNRVLNDTATNTNSMYQDIIAERKTEIDAMNGFVARHAKLMNISAPQNRAMAEKIKSVECKYLPART